MKEKEFCDRCNQIVIDKETKDFNRWMDRYELTQQREDDFELNYLLDRICKEKNRLDPINKYDEEEVIISKIVRKK